MINKQINKQLGAGLIEVMVSLLILGIGLLGVLSLQSKGLSSSQRAVFVTDAQILAQDMAGRISAFGNTSSGVNNDSYNVINVTKLNAVDLATAQAIAPCNNCNAADTLVFDQREWQVALSLSSLPRARATVTRPAGIAFYTVKVMWDAEREGGTGAVDNVVNCTGSSDCYELQVRVGS